MSSTTRVPLALLSTLITSSVEPPFLLVQVVSGSTASPTCYSSSLTTPMPHPHRAVLSELFKGDACPTEAMAMGTLLHKVFQQVYVHVCMCACELCACMYTCELCACMCACMYVCGVHVSCVHVCVHVCMCVVCMCACGVYVMCMCACVWCACVYVVCMCVCGVYVCMCV